MSFNLFSNYQINQLNDLCKNIHPSLIFAEAYYPKPNSVKSEEARFWNAVTNIYGLFYDCMPYVFRSHTQYRHVTYDGSFNRSLLDVWLKNAIIEKKDHKKIINIFYALTELRSIYCHNKPPLTINKKKLEQAFGSFHWDPYHHSTSSFNFDVAYKLFKTKITEAMDIIIKCIERLHKHSENVGLVVEWERALVGWYFQSDDIRNRSIKELKNIPGYAAQPFQNAVKLNTNDPKKFFYGKPISTVFEHVVNKVNDYPYQAHAPNVWKEILDQITL